MAASSSRPDRDESLLPRPAEVALVVGVVAVLLGTLLMPTVVIEPAGDPLAGATAERLRTHVKDPALPLVHRERALRLLAARASEADAVQTALTALTQPDAVHAEGAAARQRMLLDFVVSHPAESAAPTVLAAWSGGALTDAVWRERMLPAGWGAACAWLAVPMAWDTPRDDPERMWAFDVLANGGLSLFDVPVNGELRSMRPQRIFVHRIVPWLQQAPPGSFDPSTPGGRTGIDQLGRILLNVRALPADVIADEWYRDQLVTLVRQTALLFMGPRNAGARVEYARNVLAAARAVMLRDQLDELLEHLVETDADDADPYPAIAQELRDVLDAETTGDDGTATPGG